MRLAQVFILLLCCGTVHAQEIYKCAADGRVSYSETPCKDAIEQGERLEIRNDQFGNVTPDRQTIQATRARIQAEMSQGAWSAGAAGAMVGNDAGPAKTSNRQSRCDALEKEIADIDAAARQGSSTRRQDRLSERKRKARQKQAAWKC